MIPLSKAYGSLDSATAEPVLRARYRPSLSCAARVGPLRAAREQLHWGERDREGSAQPVPTSPRGENVLSLRDRAGKSGAQCARTSGASSLYGVRASGCCAGARGTAPVLPSSARMRCGCVPRARCNRTVSSPGPPRGPCWSCSPAPRSGVPTVRAAVSARGL
jgi:hypothetical protein